MSVAYLQPNTFLDEYVYLETFSSIGFTRCLCLAKEPLQVRTSETSDGDGGLNRNVSSLWFEPIRVKRFVQISCHLIVKITTRRKKNKTKKTTTSNIYIYRYIYINIKISVNWISFFSFLFEIIWPSTEHCTCLWFA